MTNTLNPYEPPTSASTARNPQSVRYLQTVASFIVLGSTIATGILIAFANQRPDDLPEDRRDIYVFFIGLAVVCGIAGSYLTCRYIAGNVPFYFITIALGLFVAVPLIGGGPNFAGALFLLSLIASVSLAASILTGLMFRRSLR